MSYFHGRQITSNTYLIPSSAHPPVRLNLCDLMYSSTSSRFRSSDVFMLVLEDEVPPLSGLLIDNDATVGEVADDVIVVEELFPARRPFLAD